MVIFTYCVSGTVLVLQTYTQAFPTFSICLDYITLDILCDPPIQRTREVSSNCDKPMEESHHWIFLEGEKNILFVGVKNHRAQVLLILVFLAPGRTLDTW